MSNTTSTAVINYSEEEIKQIANGIAAGLTVAQATNTDSQTLEALYSLAYKCYSVEDYASAETIFQALCLYRHDEEKYWMGLAGCRQALEKYQQAIDAYSMAGLATQLKNPLPFFYASQCFLKMGNKESAIGSIKSLLTMGDDNNSEHRLCKEKAREILKLLEENQD